MASFDCCLYCPKTKRHAGCHSSCPDYIEAKADLEKRKDFLKQANLIPPAKTDYLFRPVWRIKKR